jgi:parvulin-like peptidyl-prolyl isomerase
MNNNSLKQSTNFSADGGIDVIEQENDFYDTNGEELPVREDGGPGSVQAPPPDTADEKNEDPVKDTASFRTFVKRHGKLLTAVILLIVCVLAYDETRRFIEPSPPEENVVATYNGKHMTTDEVMEHIRLEGVREGEHMICEKHGFDHSKCDTFEECETHPIHSLEAYQRIVEILASRKIVEDWAKVKGIADREDVRHGLQDIAKELSAADSIMQVHDRELSPASIGKWEVQKYFDDNQARFQDKAFSEVEAEIRNILAEEKRETFFPEYIERLKQDAGVSLNLEILKTGAPAEAEVKEYYARNANRYVAPESGKPKDFSEVEEEIKDVLQRQKDDAYYDLNGSQTLFTIHDRRYTLRDFMREFNELPAGYQAAFGDYESKRRLVEQLLVKELLAEEQDDKTKDAREQHYFEDMRAEYFKQVLHKEEIDGKLEEPADKEARDFYEQNKAHFVLPAQVKISFISISQGLNGEKKEQAQTRADEAMEALRDGADFAETAKRYSDTPVSRVDHWVHEDDLNAVLAENVFALGQGETSGVFEVRGIFFIVRVDEREEAREQGFDEVETAIKGYLLQTKHMEAEARFERELLDKAQLRVYQKTLRKLLKENTAKAGGF